MLLNNNQLNVLWNFIDMFCYILANPIVLYIDLVRTFSGYS